MTALSATGDVAIPVYDHGEGGGHGGRATGRGRRPSRACAEPMHIVAWSTSPPWEEVVQAPMHTPSVAPPAWQGPPTHLWQPPPYIDLTDDEDDDNADN
ncbi:putative histone-lysine N-methyltransferase ATXR3 [Hordeum vulgare]|nr:putative histone-lysine N-methyltransferase ATXR3 [Hordeum vulgare]